LRTIVVTGASSGIGASLARLALARGWGVLAVARRAERLAVLEGARALPLDVLAREAPARIVQAAMETFGRIDVVVNNAGTAAPGALLEQTDAAIERQWQLHVAAPLRIARATLPQVTQAQGGFVFLGSGLARVPAPGYGAYASAKAAVRAAATQLRRELRASGVFVTYVDPGVVDTGFSLASGMQEQEAWWHAKPDAVAAAILAGIEHRAARVNAVWWQTLGTAIGEAFPALADAAMSSLVTPPAPKSADIPVTHEPATADTMDAEDVDALESALAPVRRRMERVNLPLGFVRDALVPDTTLGLSELAMRWAGMPNKNERAALHEVLDALTAAGFLRSDGEERWSVLRAAPPPSP